MGNPSGKRRQEIVFDMWITTGRLEEAEGLVPEDWAAIVREAKDLQGL